MGEANKISTAFTMHSCDVDSQTRCEGTDCGDNGPDRFKGVCDKNGCDIQPYRLGERKFWGPGSDFAIDSRHPVEVTTQFITEMAPITVSSRRSSSSTPRTARPLSTQCTLSTATSTTPSPTSSA